MSKFGTPKQDTSAEYFSVAWGNIVKKGQEWEEWVTKREYERPDGTTWVVYEHQFKDIVGTISNVEFTQSEYGESCLVTLVDNDGDVAKIFISFGSRYGQYALSFLQVLPNIDLTEPVVFNAYDFTDDNGKRKTGMSIKQNGKKIENYYYDFKEKKNINGFPKVDEKDLAKKGKKYWKRYGEDCLEFLKEQTEKMEFLGKVDKEELTQDDVAAVFDDSSFE